jgi:hypothetical protein
MIKNKEPSEEAADEGWEFSGFIMPTTTPVPDQLFDELLYRLSSAEMMVLLYIVRRTFGFKKPSDNISLRQMVEGIRTKDGRVLDRGTGLSKATVARVLASLEAKKVIERNRRRSVQRGDEPTTYRLHIPGAPAAPEPEPEFDDAPPVSQFETPRVSPVRHPRVSEKDTQQTVIQETEEQDVVVIAQELQKFGITESAATRLVAGRSATYLQAKLDFVQWLVDTDSHLAGKNPAGYLRRAIEEDYQPPPEYQTPAERQATAEAKAQADREAQERQQRLDAELAQERELTHQQLMDSFPARPIPGSDLNTHRAWQRVLETLDGTLSPLVVSTFLQPAILAHCGETDALIVAPSRFHVDHLSTKYQLYIEPTLSTILGRPIRCTYETITAVREADAPATPSASTGETRAAAATAAAPRRGRTRKARAGEDHSRPHGQALS